MMSSELCNNLPDDSLTKEKNFLIATLKIEKAEETPVNLGEQVQPQYSEHAEPLPLPMPYSSLASPIHIPFTL